MDEAIVEAALHGYDLARSDEGRPAVFTARVDQCAPRGIGEDELVAVRLRNATPDGDDAVAGERPDRDRVGRGHLDAGTCRRKRHRSGCTTEDEQARSAESETVSATQEARKFRLIGIVRHVFMVLVHLVV